MVPLKGVDKQDSENYNSTVYALEESDDRFYQPTSIQPMPYVQIKIDPDQFEDELGNQIENRHS